MAPGVIAERAVGEGRPQVLPAGVGRNEDNAGLRAELAHPVGVRSEQPGRDLVGPLGRRRGGHDDRVEAAELAVERDGIGPGARHIEEGPPARDRAGEPDRPDGRMPHQVGAGRSTVDDAEHLGRQPRPDGTAAQRLGAALRGGRMSRVRLDDHRAAGGERTGRVAAGHAERQREVARSEHAHRAERHQHAAQIRTGRGCGVRVGVIDRHVQVAAVVQHGREQP